ncbi:D-serine ammonia-lyase [Eubacteriales bacterium KG127]
MKDEKNSVYDDTIKEKITFGNEIFWLNPNKKRDKFSYKFSRKDIDDAEQRLIRFAPYIKKVFPDTSEADGIIESPLVEIPKMKSFLDSRGETFSGCLFLKCDSHLPISGSVKARGGIYEVLKLAEKLAVKQGLLKLNDDYSILDRGKFKEFFGKYSIGVGSTGNLGMSIGIIGAKLGFQTIVHMSADAKEWKKAVLRDSGVTVVEYDGDYEKAVAQGRTLAEANPYCHFVDDENSQDLFLGYSVAGRRLAGQLKEKNIIVSRDNPLYVYIPCGVGGAPGGIAFGIRDEIGENAHIYFAEPTQAPAMTLGLVTGLYDRISSKDVGLSGVTEADGLAVSRPSALVSPIMNDMLDGCFTVNDKELYSYLTNLADLENIWIEPSACAGFPGPGRLQAEMDEIVRGTHIIWATGGSAVPDKAMKEYYNKGLEKEV